MGRMDDKVALVTGAGSGIGRAAAQLLAREGAKVVLADINADGGEETRQTILEAGLEASFVQTDISKATDVAALMDHILEAHGRLDCAYNNAAILGDVVSIIDHSEETWDHVIDTNLKGTWLCMKHEIPQMLRQGNGAIVNATATAGVKGGSPQRSVYAASKAGIISLTKSAAMEYAEYGLRINVVCPSHTRTPMLAQFFELSPDLEADFIAQAPMGRIAVPEEVAEAVLWLCSDASSFVNGHVLAVDGGFLCR